MAMDQTQLVRLLVRDRAKLLAYIWSFVHDEHTAEDILQDVVAIAIAKRDQIEDASHLLGWSRNAARNKCLQALRDRSRGPAQLDESVLAKMEQQWGEYDSVDSSDVVDALSACLDELTPHARGIIKDRYAGGLTCSEIADKLGQKVNSLYVTTSRIHKTLGDCIRRRMDEEAGR